RHVQRGSNENHHCRFDGFDWLLVHARYCTSCGQLQGVPRLSAGLLTRPLQSCMPSRLRHLHETLSAEAIKQTRSNECIQWSPHGKIASPLGLQEFPMTTTTVPE